MALLSVIKVSDNVKLGLWRIEESVDAFYDRYPFLVKYRDFLLERYTSDARKLEFLAVRALLYQVMGHDVEVSHLLSGKPTIAEGNISISHTKGYAAVIVSPSENVAIDIEWVSDRVNKVASRFIREDEMVDDLERRLVIWSAKETAFKFYSEDNLLFYDMKVSDFKISDGVCQLENLKRNRMLDIHFTLTDVYVLTYAQGVDDHED